jgi:uncharacterized protein (DUF433 family)
MKKFIVTAATAALLATGGVAVAGAADSGSPSTTAPSATAPAAGAHAAAREGRVARIAQRRAAAGALALSANAIGIERKDLVTELRKGTTVAQVAQAHGVEPSAVEDALNAAIAKRVDTAVANGRFDETRAQRIKEKAAERVTKFVEDTPKRAAHARVGLRAQSLRVAATTIGVDVKDLVAQLRDGKTVAQVAQAHDVDPQKVVDAIVAAGTERLQQRAERFVNGPKGGGAHG